MFDGGLNTSHCIKMKLFIINFFSECDQIRRKLQETTDLVTFTEEIYENLEYNI